MNRIDYDAVSERYDRSRKFDAEFARELRAILPAGFAPEFALDVGCGTGNATACLAEACPRAKVAGLDLSAGMLARARAKHVDLPLIRGCASALPFVAGRFDLVLAVYVLHHLGRAAAFYADLERCLVPDGKAVLLTAGHQQIRAHFLNRFFPSFGEIDCGRFPALKQVEAGLRAAGLEVLARRDIPVAEYAVDERYLQRVRNKHISTFELMTEEEFAAGLTSLEQWIETDGSQGKRHTARGTLILAEKR